MGPDNIWIPLKKEQSDERGEGEKPDQRENARCNWGENRQASTMAGSNAAADEQEATRSTTVLGGALGQKKEEKIGEDGRLTNSQINWRGLAGPR